jgi:AraC family transcriptional regulator, regulatory protein of adaptative response / DNA-3-methyladenine glycosylase II
MEVDLKLPYNPPLHWNHLLDFLRNRAIENVEWVTDCYQRTISVNGLSGILKVEHLPDLDSLRFTIPASLSGSIGEISESVKRIFDLNADPDAIKSVFKKDRKFATIVNQLPGLRIPGAWDWFEVAIRAILGQQITVKAARTIAGRIVKAIGTPLNGNSATLFPTPEQMIYASMDGMGIPSRRIEAIRQLAKASIEKKIGPDSGNSLEESIKRLCLLPGIGPWTAHYIALRAFSETDVFLPGDLVLRRSASKLFGKNFTDVELLKYSERWRPYRSYAVFYLWSTA